MNPIRRLPSAIALALLLIQAGAAGAATFTVTSSADSGAGSLREAITLANANADLDTIEFSVGTGIVTIALATPLPTVTQPLRIDGWSQPGIPAATPGVRIDGSGSSVAPMLRLEAGACIIGDCWVRGLMLVNGKSDGARIVSGEWTIRGNYFGTDGASALPNAGSGLLVSGSGNRIGGSSASDRNLLSGNAQHGLALTGNANLVVGNYIGVDATGNGAVPNLQHGIRVNGDANLIGQSGAGSRNLISGNAQRGISIESAAADTLVRNNRIGSNAAGTAALGNGQQGVYVQGGGTVVGVAGTGNLISGNGLTGVQVTAGLSSVSVQGNFIGTDATGTAALGNLGAGVQFSSGTSVSIGGTGASQGNIISGNGGDGIVFGAAGHVGTLVAGNLIGTDLSGTAALPNAGSGIAGNGGGDIDIGGASADARNLISGNGDYGIYLYGTADGIHILGNRIGTTGDGSAALGNANIGVRVTSGTNIRIGGNTAAEGNLVSGNGGTGITIESAVVGAQVLGNRIGTDASGTSALPNQGGLGLAGQNVDVGFNLISGNAGGGASIAGATVDGIALAGNLIGITADGSGALGNDGIGLRILNGSNLAIGVAIPGGGNVFAANQSSNLTLEGGVDGATVYGNRIGTDASGTVALSPDAGGIGIGGRNISLLQNLISGNGQGGVGISGDQVEQVTLSGNRIGTTLDGSAALANGSTGVRVIQGAGITIGGATPAEGNLISGNIARGLTLEGGVDGALVRNNLIGPDATGAIALSTQSGGIDIGGRNIVVQENVVSGNANGGIGISGAAVENISLIGNRIGTNPAGTAAVPNGSSGIRVIQGSGITIGGSLVSQRNLISGNDNRALTLEGGVDGAVVQGNYIGTDITGLVALSTQSGGIDIGGKNIQIGGAAAGEGNLISGNANGGIGISGGDVQGVQILGNRIGTTPNGMTALPNGSYGIRAISGTGVTIGGSQAGAGNLISGNGRGVAIEDGMIGTLIQGNIIGLNASQNAKLPNGDWSGLDISAPDTVVGGSAPGAGNVIAGNWGSGIVLWGEASSGVVIQGNFIGTNTAGASGLGNRLAGIQIDRSHAALIGGDGPGEGNTIAHNEFNGILQRWGDGNSVLGNRFFDNGLLAIDSEPQGPQTNDPLDADGGPNFAQNHPVLSSALADGASIAVEGLLQSQPSSTYLVEFVHSPACDPSGIGEGGTSLGFLPLQTDAQGAATFAHALASSETMGVVTALATAPDGSTSEFSPCHALTGPNPGTFQFWRDPFLSWEGQPYLEVTVVRSMGNAGAASVLFETLDDSALANADYLPVSELLEFADGEVMKTIQVPIVADSLVENQEQFKVRLSAPTGGATLGAQAEVPAIIINVGADFPMYLIDDVTADEPVAGTADFTFTVTLTPSLLPQSIAYVTQSATAVEGEDFEPVSGTLEFPASDVVQTQTVSVPIKADGTSEANETFYLQLSASGNIAVFKGTGIGTIRNTDPPPPPLEDAIFSNGFED